MTLDIDAIERLAGLPVGKIDDLVYRFNTAEQEAHADITNAMIRLQDETAAFYNDELTALCAEVREQRAALEKIKHLLGMSLDVETDAVIIAVEAACKYGDDLRVSYDAAQDYINAMPSRYVDEMSEAERAAFDKYQELMP